jgi:hypothetical protein
MRSSVKKLVADLAVNEPSLSLVVARKGAYDKDVEVFTNGEVVATYLSQVKVGQPWRVADGSSAGNWFVCVSPIKADYSRDSKNPTFILGNLNVLQAPAIESWAPKPTALPSAQQPRRLTSCKPSDIQDVDFK